MTKMTRSILLFACAVFVLSVSVPTASFAAETFKDVVVRNTDANPIPVKVTSGAARLRHGQGIVGPAGGAAAREIAVPATVVLTDLVVARASGEADTCNVVLFETRGTDQVVLAQLFPTVSDASRALQFTSGITADRLAVAVNNDCYVNVLWSGFER